MRSDKIKSFLNEQKIILLIIVIFVVMFIKTPNFLSMDNIYSILIKISIEGIIVIGMTYLIILKEIDLSVGSVMALGSAMSIILQKFGIIPGIFGGILVGAVIGTINGIFVVKLRVASIAATLGMMVLINGIVFVITKSLAPAGGNYSISGTNENFQYVAGTTFFSIPTLIIILIILVILFQIILKKTVYGRNIYATGGNLLASKYANIKVEGIRISVFLLTGSLSGLAGVLLASKYNVASWQIGTNTPLFVITAVLLGGVSLLGGEGSVLKAFQGLLLVGVIDNVMLVLKTHSSVKFMILGVLLIIIISIDGLYIRKAKYL